MRRTLVPALMAGLTCGMTGCGFVLDQVTPNTTTVRLVNDGDFDVHVELFIDDDQEIPRDLLTEVGTNLEFTLSPGEATSFSRDCDDLQAIVIDSADLDIVGDVGPSADTDVLRDGSDFGCGDTIRFAFDHSDVVVDFDISVAVDAN